MPFPPALQGDREYNRVRGSVKHSQAIPGDVAFSNIWKEVKVDMLALR